MRRTLAEGDISKYGNEEIKRKQKNVENRSLFVLKKMGRGMCRIFLGICVFLGAIHACEYRTLAAPISDTGEILQGNSSCILTDEEAVTITISAVGDCTLGNDIKQEGYGTCFHKVYNIMGPDYFLENVRPIFQKDDLTIANLEGVLTNLGAPSQTKTWRFQSPPEYMQILTGSSVEAVSFANNHCRDYGEISFTDTKANLDLYGIDYASEDHPLVMDIKGVKVGLVALQCAIRSPRADLAEYPDTDALARLLKAEMASVKEAGAQVIIVNMHWGVERQLTASPQQIALGHFAVDQGADLVNVHVEADSEENILAALQAIRAKGKKCGITLKPATPAEAAIPYLKLVDLVLVMTVEPGFGGQSFMVDMLQKIRLLRGLMDEVNPGCELEVDGGITAKTAVSAKAAGANVLVAGSAVFGEADRASAIAAIRNS